jgi:branched-chain amino acid aminotransferase
MRTDKPSRGTLTGMSDDQGGRAMTAPDVTAGSTCFPRSAFSRGAAFVDGQLVPIVEARIPILDTGFTRSDLTYDVVAVWEGAFFRLEDHLDRFERGCERLRLRLALARDEIRGVLHELVGATGLRQAYVEVICTRGIDRDGTRDPRTFENRFYAYAIPYVWITRPDATMDGVIARTVTRISPSSVDPTVKNFHWGDLTRGQFEAYDRGGRHPLLLDADDHLTEGAGYNAFVVSEGRMATPDAGVLEGITRRTAIELGEELGVQTAVRAIHVDELRDADELFATSTAGGIMPITRLDGNPVGDGQPGPITARLRDAYWAAHRDPRFISQVSYDTTHQTRDLRASP